MKSRNSNNQQRTIFSTSRILSVLFCLGLLVIPVRQANARWEQVSEILSRIKAPRFPNRDFTITDYGAVADNERDCTFDNVQKSNILIGVENLAMDNVKINGEPAK